jgi:putative FmdB family regulatory protein
MPTYEYTCENDHHFEDFQSMLAAPLEVCPVCGSKATRIISGGTGLIFKGSGFYITDYKKSNVSHSSSPKKEPVVAKTEEKTSTETKPATETPTTNKTEDSK